MSKVLTIASFNVQNSYMRKNVNEEDTIQELLDIINREKIDILCCQEMIKTSLESLKKKLVDYHIIGKYRYGNNAFSKNITFLRKYNESTPILTNQRVIKSENYHLPWFPINPQELKNGIFKYHSVTPRILTEALLKIDDTYFLKVFNTHLEKRIVTIKRKQLAKIKRFLKRSTYPVILAGDFNMGLDQKLFQKFVDELEKLHLKRVDFQVKTWKNAKKDIAIDHIFIPKNWKILEQKRIENNISDHYMILVKVEIIE